MILIIQVLKGSYFTTLRRQTSVKEVCGLGTLTSLEIQLGNFNSNLVTLFYKVTADRKTLHYAWTENPS